MFLLGSSTLDDAFTPSKSDRSPGEPDPVHPAKRLHGQPFDQRQADYERKVNLAIILFYFLPIQRNLAKKIQELGGRDSNRKPHTR